MPKKEIRINVRADENTKQRVQKICELTGASETNLVIACVDALIDYVEEHGEITLPLVVLPRSKSPTGRVRKIAAYSEPGQLALAAEQPRIYEETLSPSQLKKLKRGDSLDAPAAKKKSARYGAKRSKSAAAAPKRNPHK